MNTRTRQATIKKINNILETTPGWHNRTKTGFVKKYCGFSCWTNEEMAEWIVRLETMFPEIAVKRGGLGTVLVWFPQPGLTGESLKKTRTRWIRSATDAMFPRGKSEDHPYGVDIEPPKTRLTHHYGRLSSRFS
jgi:hypothetical protein